MSLRRRPGIDTSRQATPLMTAELADPEFRRLASAGHRRASFYGRLRFGRGARWRASTHDVQPISRPARADGAARRHSMRAPRLHCTFAKTSTIRLPMPPAACNDTGA